jgi:Uma2 family endonuclease
MDAVWIDVPEEFLEERARLGHDRKDELWEGVLHLVSPAGSPLHGFVALNLTHALGSIGARLGLVAYIEVGVYAPEVDPVSWRVPDGSLARPEQASERGLEGAVLALEVLSPRDESRKKLAFYAHVGIAEVWLVDPKTRQPEIYTIVDGAFVQVTPIDGVHRSPLLGITIRVIAGPKLQLCDGDEIVEV